MVATSRNGCDTVRVQVCRHANLFFRSNSGLTAHEGIMKATDAGLVVASYKLWDTILQNGDLSPVLSALPAWTGTWTAYKEPGEKFDDMIYYEDRTSNLTYVFPVPQKFRNEKDAILVCEHEDFHLGRNGSNIVVVASNVEIVRNFPPEDGNYLTDPVHGLPCGLKIAQPSLSLIRSSNEVDKVQLALPLNSNTRTLFRIGHRVGPVSVANKQYARSVGLVASPSMPLGIAVQTFDPNASVEHRDSQLSFMTESDGTLVVRGTPSMVAAVAKFIEVLKNPWDLLS